MPVEELKPIYSSLDEDPAAGETIDAFIVGLAERVDVLQDTEREGNLAQLAVLASGLIADAERAGFESLVSIGRQLERACFDYDGKTARDRLCGLTADAQRARLGHKGAV